MRHLLSNIVRPRSSRTRHQSQSTRMRRLRPCFDDLESRKLLTVSVSPLVPPGGSISITAPQPGSVTYNANSGSIDIVASDWGSRVTVSDVPFAPGFLAIPEIHVEVRDYGPLTIQPRLVASQDFVRIGLTRINFSGGNAPDDFYNYTHV